jgi:hypothetical protein
MLQEQRTKFKLSFLMSSGLKIGEETPPPPPAPTPKEPTEDEKNNAVMLTVSNLNVSQV